MKYGKITHSFLVGTAIQGFLLAGAVAPMLLAVSPSGDYVTWRLVTGVVGTVACLLAGSFFFSHSWFRQILVVTWALAGVVAGWPAIMANPIVALVATTTLISIGFACFDLHVDASLFCSPLATARAIYRIRAAAMTPLLLLLLNAVLGLAWSRYSFGVLVLSSLAGQYHLFQSAGQARSPRHQGIAIANALLLAAIWGANIVSCMSAGIVAVCVGTLIFLPRSDGLWTNSGQWWSIVTNHSSRVLLFGFFLLCTAGTFLLLFPVAWHDRPISVIDAAFTATSAVCVTGLVVLDTSKDFTWTGQLFILLLIQLGGIGIMTLTAVALHAFGHRMSLRQEHLFTTTTETHHSELYLSLWKICQFTAIVESCGAVLLFLFFLLNGMAPGKAVWNSVFTAISAFCNAGFFLDTNNLVPWQNHPLVLHTVAILIILGGIAPATSVLIPQWLKRRPVAVSVQLALTGTALLLTVGTILILAFEWNGFLKGLDFWDKIHNAWFQCVTLRTAGFNSVDLTKTTDATWLIMILWMFIGGSPGGTAGGIKTTTAAVLLLTLWNNIRQRDDVVLQSRKIPNATIYRAITITLAGIIVLFAISLLLMVTQSIPAKQILFEVASALGTVGLTLGATPCLDELGKAAIIATMFIGRVGPITLFMFLTDSRPTRNVQYPEAKISIS